MPRHAQPRIALFRALPLLIALLALPARALDLRSAGGFLFDVSESGDGSLMNGSVDAYDVMYVLTVEGTTYYGTGTYSLNLDGRGVKMPEVPMGAVLVRRLVYVPKSEGNFARYLDVFTNRGAADVTLSVSLGGNLGSDSTTELVATSTGGGLGVTPADTWIVTDDLDATGDPSLAHVIQGPSARVRPNMVSLSMDNLSWQFTVTVPAGGQAAVLTFAVQESERTRARLEAERLVALPPEALVGIEDYRGAIVNF